jgi:hypothetical protein
MSRRTSDDGRGKALDLWQAPKDAGEPLVCIASSFTFDATFFEIECVGRFLQMDNHPSESESVGYLIEREEKLAAAKVCALVDRRHARDKESLRWDIIGVLVPRAIQHSKVSLLVWGNHARVIIGSGNLTEPGYRKNVEIFGAIELSKKDGGDRASVEQTIAFLEQVLALGVGDDAAGTPKDRVRQALSAVRRRVSHWPDHNGASRAPTPIFGVPKRGVLPQMLEEWPSGGPPRTAWVVSPFFDRPGRDVDTVKALVAGLAQRGSRDITLCVRAQDLPNGRTRVYAPLGLVKAARETCDVEVRSVLRIQDGEIRDLHAKMVCLENEQWSLLLAGSSNFTAAGLTAATGGSCEANLLYRVKVSDPLYRRLNELWPDLGDEALDLDSKKLVWDPEPEECEGVGDEVPLPACFRDAIFVPGKEPKLVIQLTAELPRVWGLRVPGGSELLGSTVGTKAGQHDMPWGVDPVPFVLEVTWQRGDETAVASWPVNVSNPSALPPPDALRDLSLEELLEILGSTRPLQEAVVQVLKKRAKGAKRVDIELDPLKRLDSQTFLLRRTKRVALALDRLRDRLERPALTRDAFEWRLNGAIGPTMLANAFVKEALVAGEAKFYLAELALTLKRVRPQRAADGGVRTAEVEELLETALADLKLKTKELPTTPETTLLDGYVSAAFRSAAVS